MELKPGDRIFYSGAQKNAYGVVLGPSDGKFIPIRFDEKIGAHDCRGLCEYGYGWYASPRLLKFISREDDAQEDDSAALNISNLL